MIRVITSATVFSLQPEQENCRQIWQTSLSAGVILGLSCLSAGKKTSESHPAEYCCETSSGKTTKDDSATIQYIHTE